MSFWHAPTPAPTRESRCLGGGPHALQHHLISTNFPPSRFLVRQSATTRMRALDGPSLGYTRRATCLPTNPDHGMCTIRNRLAGLHTPPSIHSIANSGIPSLYSSGSARATPRSRRLWLSRRILLASEPETEERRHGGKKPFPSILTAGCGRRLRLVGGGPLSRGRGTAVGRYGYMTASWPRSNGRKGEGATAHVAGPLPHRRHRWEWVILGTRSGR